VPILTVDTFDEYIGAHGAVMVEFNCIYGADHMSEFVTAAGKVRGPDLPLEFAVVRKDDMALCERFNIRSYPQFVVFEGGEKTKHEQYIGDEGKLIEYVEGFTGTAVDIVRTVQSEAAAAALLTPAAPVVFVAVAAPGSGTHARFKRVANEFRSSGWFAFVPAQPTAEGAAAVDEVYVLRANESKVSMDDVTLTWDDAPTAAGTAAAQNEAAANADAAKPKAKQQQKQQQQQQKKKAKVKTKKRLRRFVFEERLPLLGSRRLQPAVYGRYIQVVSGHFDGQPNPHPTPTDYSNSNPNLDPSPSPNPSP
jgi:hypothetical protein